MARSVIIENEDLARIYLQGSDDKWGSVEDVQAMAAATPNSTGPILVPSQERFGGYMALVNEPQPIIDFLAPLLGDGGDGMG